MEPDGRDGRDADKENQNEKLPASSSRTTSPSLEHESHNAKATSILEACKENDIETLRKLAVSEGGLVSDEVRRQACPYYYGKLQKSTTDRDRAASSWLYKPR